MQPARVTAVHDRRPHRLPVRARKRPWIIGILGLAFIAALSSPSSADSASTASAAALESALVLEINALRQAKGLRPLSPSRALVRAAASHSSTMLAKGFFAHEVAGGEPYGDRLRRFYPVTGPGWHVGENLAVFGPRQPSARDVVRVWLGSPPHRANLLSSRWRELGVAARYATPVGGALGSGPTWVITLELGRRS